MNELSQFMNRKAEYKTSILKAPNGKYIFVGSVPLSLCHKKDSLFGEQWISNVYNTREEAEKALITNA